MEAEEEGEEGGKYTLGRFGVLTRVATAIRNDRSIGSMGWEDVCRFQFCDRGYS